MRPRREGLRETAELQALYSIAILARMGNISVERLRRVLRSAGVVLIRGGRALFVPLSEVQRKIPPLWDSLVLTEQVRRGGRAPRDTVGGG